MKILPMALLGLLFAVLAPAALAVPGTYTITVDDMSVSAGTEGGAVDGWRIYQGCDLTAQTRQTPAVAAPATVGSTYRFAGDNASPPVLCAVPFNSAGEGGFANVVTLDAVQQPPGSGVLNLRCEFVADTGEIYACSGTVSQ